MATPTWVPATAVTADLVAFDPPETLEQLFGSGEVPPEAGVLLAGAGGDSTPRRVDLTGVWMLGLVLRSSPETPEMPAVYLEGLPFVTSGRACGVAVELRPVE